MFDFADEQDEETVTTGGKVMIYLVKPGAAVTPKGPVCSAVEILNCKSSNNITASSNNISVLRNILRSFWFFKFLFNNPSLTKKFVFLDWLQC